MSILVIDDEVSIRNLLHTVLKRKGYEVFLADSGQKGVDMFERIHPPITILDLYMQDLNGLDVLSHIRAIDPKAFVIMLTGVGTKEAETKALTLGADVFLRKGFSLFELGEALRGATARMSNAPGFAATSALPGR